MYEFNTTTVPDVTMVGAMSGDLAHRIPIALALVVVGGIANADGR